MFRLKIKSLLSLGFLLWFSVCTCFAQELPPVHTFSTDDYLGANQNWDISQGDQGDIYVANNEGVLAFNGSSWELHPMPNNTIVRAVHAKDSRIYAGCYMDFGYWQKNSSGTLYYTSLVGSMNQPMIDDEHVWRIFSLDNFVLFQTLDRIYIYDSDSTAISVIESQGIFKMYELDQSFYFQDINKKLYQIVNGQAQLVQGLENFIDYNIISLFNQDDALLILTEKNGFFKFDNQTIQPFKTDLDTVLEGLNIYNAIRLEDDSFVIGSISRGLIQLNTQGELMLALNQSLGLGNNTVLSLFEDSYNNVWAGLDNGLAVINVNSPLKIYNDKEGKIGAVYANIEYKDRLYLGSNQGLFVSTDASRSDFEFVVGTSGQVWSLFVHDGVLFCGHNEGTFVIDGASSKKIFDFQGTWTFTTVPEIPGFILQGNYSGLSYLVKNAGTWEFGGVFSGFNISARFLERESENRFWVNHEYKGVYKLELDFNKKQVTKVVLDTSVTKGLYSSLTRVNNQLLYSSKNGIYLLEPPKTSFKRDSLLSDIWDSTASYVSGKIIADERQNLWVFNKYYVNFIQPNSLGQAYRIEQIPLSQKLRREVTGFENVSQLANGQYVMGTTSGYLTFDTKRLISHKANVRLEAAQLLGRNSDTLVNIFDQKGVFNPKFNTANFRFTAPIYDAYLFTEYQHKLDGFDSDWSQWSEAATVDFSNLSPGAYTFQVRSRQGKVMSDNIASYSFEIQTPWYKSTLAYIFYIVGFALLVILIHNLYKAYYKKQRQKLIDENQKKLEVKQLETETQIIQLRNESLKQAVDSKNKELAISTMAMIKKSELLNTIKKELTKYKGGDSDTGIKAVTSIIDDNLFDKKEWKVFEEAFNNTDKDFIKKLKAMHPSLTSNDLRLCSFLRLNLSSKEIAPLLNISPRSVEIKRYRLRKKMELPKATNLSNYILQI